MSDGPDQPGAGGTDAAAGAGVAGDGGAGLVSEGMTLDQAVSALKETRQEAATRRKRQRELETELETLKAAGQTDTERAIATARKETEDSLTATHRKEITALRVQTAAATKLHDPEDAVRHLDLEQFADIDQAKLPAAISKALDELLEAKPYLAKSDNGARREPISPGPRTPAGQGAGNGGDGTNDNWLRKAARK